MGRGASLAPPDTEVSAACCRHKLPRTDPTDRENPLKTKWHISLAERIGIEGGRCHRGASLMVGSADDRALRVRFADVAGQGYASPSA
jgi:hypothetical protein